MLGSALALDSVSVPDSPWVPDWMGAPDSMWGPGWMWAQGSARGRSGDRRGTWLGRLTGLGNQGWLQSGNRCGYCTRRGGRRWCGGGTWQRRRTTFGLRAGFRLWTAFRKRNRVQYQTQCEQRARFGLCIGFQRWVRRSVVTPEPSAELRGSSEGAAAAPDSDQSA